LIHHSVSMCKVAEQITKIYPNASYDLLISGCLLHDIGKVIEFSDPITPSYTNEGNLLGHISI
ncbi:MAG TPA: 3'-5' exonuclease, partial [Firmicutes bacterium]|nr:3'-5' exonuclease [Bacillota bacterium]